MFIIHDKQSCFSCHKCWWSEGTHIRDWAVARSLRCIYLFDEPATSGSPGVTSYTGRECPCAPGGGQGGLRNVVGGGDPWCGWKDTVMDG